MQYSKSNGGTAVYSNAHQVFSLLRNVVPFWTDKLVLAVHYVSQHDQLLSVPKWWETSQPDGEQRESNVSWKECVTHSVYIITPHAHLWTGQTDANLSYCQ